MNARVHIGVILAILTLSLTLPCPESVAAPAEAQQPPAFSDHQKETLTAIKDMTTNLLLLGVGVFALVGGYLAKDQPVTFQARRRLIASFLFFGVSLVAGLVVFMNLISQLQAGKFDPNSAWLRWASGIQIVTIGIGAVLFFFFLVPNIGGTQRNIGGAQKSTGGTQENTGGTDSNTGGTQRTP